MNTEIVNLETWQSYETGQNNWLLLENISERTPGLFKPDFFGTSSVWVTAKCYLVQYQNEIEKCQYSYKGARKHNDLYFQHYKDALDASEKTGIDSGLDRSKYWESQECRLQTL